MKAFILGLMLAFTAVSVDAVLLAHSATAMGNPDNRPQSQRVKVFSVCASESFTACLLAVTGVSAQTRLRQLPWASATTAPVPSEARESKLIGRETSISGARTQRRAAKSGHSLAWRTVHAL